ncbi:MAG: Bax inhibitor-1 family protein [Puniceicoccales bacterium]|jgi:FtsH-binding integral membrane protein|nr:Bax inhibitor-1 family protein [Puniceicoccales bacterium]
MNEIYDNPFAVADASAELRARFYRKTYGLVALSFLAWAGTLGGFFMLGLAEPLLHLMLGTGRFAWLIVLGLFWVATSIGQSMAYSRGSTLKQYLGLGIYIVAEALIFVPLIALVAARTGGDIMEILAPAGAVTGLLILALTATVFMTRQDFSFLGAVVGIGSVVALGAIVVFTLFNVGVGSWFAFAMVALMGAAILWQTWRVKEQCSPDQHVGAALSLFAGFVTLLWYVVQIFLSRRD